MSGISDELTVLAIHLHLFYNEEKISNATGFLYRDKSNQIFLISNHHVLSGYNPLTGQPMHKYGSLPNKLKFQIPAKREIEGKEGFSLTVAEKSLCNDEEQPIWKMHATFGKEIDVGALPIGKDDEHLAWTINDATQNHLFDNFTLTPSTDVFIIRFPLGLSGGSLALWKRGTIASEPSLNINGK